MIVIKEVRQRKMHIIKIEDNYKIQNMQSTVQQFIYKLEKNDKLTQIHVAKKATAVVTVVKSIAPAASGKAISAISSVVASFGLELRALFHLSTATNISTAPIADARKSQPSRE